MWYMVRMNLLLIACGFFLPISWEKNPTLLFPWNYGFYHLIFPLLGIHKYNGFLGEKISTQRALLPPVCQFSVHHVDTRSRIPFNDNLLGYLMLSKLLLRHGRWKGLEQSLREEFVVAFLYARCPYFPWVTPSASWEAKRE